MDKKRLLDKAGSSEERMLFARVLDKWEQCSRKHIPSVTPFLSEGEQAQVKSLLTAAGIVSGYQWDGGYEGASRKVLVFQPDWAEGMGGDLTAVRSVYHGGEQPNHRELLGSLMGLGITREKVGDLLVSPDSCDVITTREMAGFLVENWLSAGRIRLTVTEISLDTIHIPQQQFKEIRDTVMALRLDAVLSSGFSISRTKASELVKSGRVQVNHVECTKGDRLLKEGDVLTMRGFGKCIISEVGGLSKKGRTNLLIKRYL